MSLINQMLADLERRSGISRSSALDPEIRAVTRPRRPWLGIGALLAAGAIAGVTMTAYWGRQAAEPGKGNAAPRPLASTEAVQVTAAQSPSERTALPSAKAGAIGEGEPEAMLQAAERPADAPGLPEQAVAPAPTPPAKEGPRPETEPAGGALPPVAPQKGLQTSPQALMPPAESLSTEGNPVPGSASRPPASASEKTDPRPAPGPLLSIDKQIRPPTAEEQAENEFRRGLAALQQHRDAEAMDAFRAALERDSRHETARQSLVALLLAGHRLDEAESVLAEGLALNPRQVGFATALARIQVERGAIAAALDTLAAVAPYGGASAQFEAFYAALLHRAGRHRDAADHYARALQIAPGTGVWLLGMGLALQADGRPGEARAAFEQARASGQLSAELAAFVDQRLGQ